MLRRKSSRYPTPAQKRERYADCKGVFFDQCRLWLPQRTAEWPQVTRVNDHTLLATIPRIRCWRCRVEPIQHWLPIEVHHIVGGTKGRSDEWTNLIPLCQTCHGIANTKLFPLGQVLFKKWFCDRAHVDWVRLTLLRRQHLPDLITE